LVVRPGDGSLSLHALLRDFIRENWPLDRSEECELPRRAAAWLSDHGRHADAPSQLVAVGSSPG
jgi:hypothetical protein